MIQVGLILLGVGGVGRSLLRLILKSRGEHADRYRIHLNIRAICDSRAFLWESAGLDERSLQETLSLKQDGGGLGRHRLAAAAEDAPSALAPHIGPGDIVVDCTACQEVVGTLLKALSSGAGVVLANKRPLTGDQTTYDRLASSCGLCRWEATVGSGVPIIAALNRLRAGGDQVLGITGAASGTLGRLMTGIQKARPFSRLIQEAHQAGATEPDPREDLSGRDVARKALILARGMGLRLELNDISVESLYPAEMDALSLERFLSSLDRLDGPFRARSRKAAEKKHVLRYGLRVEAHACRVGPIEAPIESPLGRLQGADNLFEVTSRYYPEAPLLLQGRGAGVEATASGVLSDIIDLAFSFKLRPPS